MTEKASFGGNTVVGDRLDVWILAVNRSEQIGKPDNQNGKFNVINNNQGNNQGKKGQQSNSTYQ